MPFHDEAVVVVGCGTSGKDTALDLRRVTRRCTSPPSPMPRRHAGHVEDVGISYLTLFVSNCRRFAQASDRAATQRAGPFQRSRFLVLGFQLVFSGFGNLLEGS